MNLKRILTLPLLLALSLGAGAQQAEVVRLFAENPDRASNNMHSYEFDPIVDTPAPKGFKPFYITHYGRHGSRYEQNSTFARNAQAGFTYLDSLGLLTPAGDAGWQGPLGRCRGRRRCPQGHGGVADPARRP